MKKMNFINIGLPSGTLWAEKSSKEFYNWKQAIKKFGENLPTKEQFQELVEECKWEWDDKKKGYKITGPNGNSIFLETAGWKNKEGHLHDKNKAAYYWSSTEYEYEEDVAYCLAIINPTFTEPAYAIGGDDIDNDCYSIRLVKKA